MLVPSKTSPERGGGPPDAVRWWRGDCSLQKATMPSIAAFRSLSTNDAGMRSTANPRDCKYASRRRSRSGRSPISCALPSISIATRRSRQAKSSASSLRGWWRRNLNPPGRLRSSRQTSASGRLPERRSRFASLKAWSEADSTSPPPACGWRSPSPSRGGFCIASRTSSERGGGPPRSGGGGVSSLTS